jgi:hypothetical protein
MAATAAITLQLQWKAQVHQAMVHFQRELLIALLLPKLLLLLPMRCLPWLSNATTHFALGFGVGPSSKLHT